MVELITKQSPVETMTDGDLISRQAALDEALTFFVEYLGGAFDEDSQMLLAQRMNSISFADITETELCEKCQEATERVLNNQGERIKELEAAETSGEWVKNDNGIYVCGNCGYMPSSEGYTYYHYCPNCGARMDGGDTE